MSYLDSLEDEYDEQLALGRLQETMDSMAPVLERLATFPHDENCTPESCPEMVKDNTNFTRERSNDSNC